LAAAITSSTTGAGTAALAPLPARQASVAASTVTIIATIRNENLDIPIPPCLSRRFLN
jgi:FlaG/FlaF family flagellin (archaellin)